MKPLFATFLFLGFLTNVDVAFADQGIDPFETNRVVNAGQGELVNVLVGMRECFPGIKISTGLSARKIVLKGWNEIVDEAEVYYFFQKGGKLAGAVLYRFHAYYGEGDVLEVSVLNPPPGFTDKLMKQANKNPWEEFQFSSDSDRDPSAVVDGDGTIQKSWKQLNNSPGANIGQISEIRMAGANNTRFVVLTCSNR